ncbi:MAG: DUF2059 domain-containing protein [Acidobacteriota bacterium]
MSLFSCAVQTGHADDATKLAKVHEFFKLTKMDQMTAQVMNQVKTQLNSGMMQQMTGFKLTPDQQQSVDAFSAKIDKVIFDALSWDNLEPQYAKLYAAAYTEQQIDDILTFYRSPTGRAVVEKSPVLMKESNAIAQQRLAAVMPQLRELMTAFKQQETAKAKQTQH